MAIVPRDVVDMRRTYLPAAKYDSDGYDITIAAIDWGVRHSCIIIGVTTTGQIDILRMLSIPESSSYEDINADVKKIVQELRLYNPTMVLADIGYQGTRINQLINALGRDKVFGVQVKPTLSNGEVRPVWNENNNTVSVDKLTNNIAMINMIKSHDVGIYSEDDEMQELFIEHLQNIVIRDEEDENTGDLKKIITRKGGDHLGQALMMAIVGLRHILDERGLAKNSAFKYTSLSPVDSSAPTGEEYYGNQLTGLNGGNELGDDGFSSTSIFD